MTEFLVVSGANLKTCFKFHLSDRKVKRPERVIFSSPIELCYKGFMPTEFLSCMRLSRQTRKSILG